jgi:hypothetical protein
MALLIERVVEHEQRLALEFDTARAGERRYVAARRTGASLRGACSE